MGYSRKCNRCGQFYDVPLEPERPIQVQIVGLFRECLFNYDLCPECMSELKKFMDEIR